MVLERRWAVKNTEETSQRAPVIPNDLFFESMSVHVLLSDSQSVKNGDS